MTRPAYPTRLLAALAVLLAACCTARAAEPLPKLGADETRTSVSGLSSGAYMAGQFQVAYSKLVIGAGLIAGGPYGCAYTPGIRFVPVWALVLGLNVDRAQKRCMQAGGFFSGGVPSTSLLAEEAKSLASSDRIDPLEGLANDKIYIFSGANDDTVERPVVERAVELYEAFGVPRGSITFVKNEKAGHAFITEAGGLACGVKGEPFIEDCDYDQAKAVLEAIYGRLRGSETAAGQYVTFDQKPFLPGPGGSGMADEGVVYIPESCAREPGCAPHVVFHGCKQGREKLGDAFIKESGYARWAASNRIILLFPQIQSSSVNPNGCWDWWGYTGRRFLEREAPQMVAVRKMIATLAAR
jgi:hypothetical protein